MTKQEFLSENRQEVINFYSNEIATFWTISLKDFMLDLMTNFEKITTGELKKFDLFGNLNRAKSRLGLFNACTVEAEDKVTNALKAKYNGTAYMAMV